MFSIGEEGVKLINIDVDKESQERSQANTVVHAQVPSQTPSIPHSGTFSSAG